MFLTLTLLSLCAYAYGEEGIVTHVSEMRQTKTVSDIHEVCHVTGYEVHGFAWRYCKEGRSITIGCAVEGERLKFNEFYSDSIAQWQCVQDGDDVLLIPVACVLRGEKIPLGSERRHGSFVYECIRRNPKTIGLDIVGCVTQSGNSIPIGGVFPKGKFLFKCQKEGGRAFTEGFMCMFSETGFEYPIGHSWTHKGYAYECQKKGERSIKLAVVGCADSRDKRVEIGDEMVEDQVVYRCEDTEEGVTHVPIGCYAKDHRDDKFRLFSFGDQFYESYKEGFGYIVECVKHKDIVKREFVKCVYHHRLGDVTLDIGCGAVVGQKAFICKKVEDGGVMARLMSLPADKSLDTFFMEMEIDMCRAPEHIAQASSSSSSSSSVDVL